MKNFQIFQKAIYRSLIIGIFILTSACTNKKTAYLNPTNDTLFSVKYRKNWEIDYNFLERVNNDPSNITKYLTSFQHKETRGQITISLRDKQYCTLKNQEVDDEFEKTYVEEEGPEVEAFFKKDFKKINNIIHERWTSIGSGRSIFLFIDINQKKCFQFVYWSGLGDTIYEEAENDFYEIIGSLKDISNNKK